ncbi:MAG: T9SS type A sorting domain-containing protein [Bacteroidota bacterium]
MKVLKTFRIGLLLSLSWLAISTIQAQVTACEDETVSVSVSNANTTAPYVLEYMLACGGTVTQVNATGLFDLAALSVSAGSSCVIYAINYDPNQTNDLTVAPPTGDCLEFIEQTLTVLNTPDLTVMNISNTCPATTADLTSAVTDADGGTLAYFEADGTTAVADETAVGAGTYVITSTVSGGGVDCTDSEMVTVTILDCECIDACANSSVTATVTGANTTAPYVLEYVLVCGGNVVNTSPNTTGTFDLSALGVNPGDDCSIFAANYDSNDPTVDLTVFPFEGDCLETEEQTLCVQGFNSVSATTDCGPDDPDRTGIVTIMVNAVIDNPNSVFCIYKGTDLLLSTTFGAASTGVPNMYQVMLTQTGLDGSTLTFGLTFAEPGATCPVDPASADCATDETVSPDCPLPAEVTSFSGNTKGVVNMLYWQTASEFNTAWHIIERSADGKSNWEEIGRVAAAGYSLSIKSYTLEDQKPLRLSYYRLRVIDTDGTIDYPADAIVLKRTLVDDEIKVFPNPTNGLVNIAYQTGETKNVIVNVTDIFGSTLVRQTSLLNAGDNQLTLTLDDLPSGVYFINISDGITQKQIHRIVKH